MVDLVKYAYVWDIGFKEWPGSFTSGRIWYMTPMTGHFFNPTSTHYRPSATYLYREQTNYFAPVLVA